MSLSQTLTKAADAKPHLPASNGPTLPLITNQSSFLSFVSSPNTLYPRSLWNHPSSYSSLSRNRNCHNSSSTTSPLYPSHSPIQPSPTQCSPNPEGELKALIDFCLKEISCETPISIVLINIRSLMCKMHTLRIFSAIVKPSFICITETWLKHTVTDAAIALPDYNIHRTDRVTKSGGGCLIYSRADINASVADVSTNVGPLESICINLKHATSPLLVGCIYLPPKTSHSSSHILDFLAEVNASDFSSKILVGDFNLPKTSWRDPTNNSSLVAQLRHDGWVQHTTSPTRGDYILDLVLTNGDFVTNTAVGPLFPGSDHNVVISTICDIQPIPVVTQYFYHKLTPCILHSFCSLLRSTDWSEYFLSQTVQNSANILYATVLHLLHLVSPPLRTSSKSRLVDKSSLKLLRSLKRARKEYNETRSLGSLLSINRIASYTQTLRYNRELYQEQSVLSHALDPTALRKLMRSRKPSSLDHITLLQTSDGTLCSTPLAISESMNLFFSSCYTGDLEATKILCLSDDSQIDAPTVTLSTIPIKLPDVYTQLRTLKPSAIPGPDGIPATLLINGETDIPLLLHHLYTVSLEHGVIPKQWKLSTVTPRYKSGPRIAASSYRGIHHTSLLLRVLERMIKPYLIKHFHSRKLVSPRQHGFLSRRSTSTNLTDFFEVITSAYEAGHAIVLIYLDISKAFDRVPHNALLHYLSHAGITGALLKWFKSYLTDRFQTTRISSYSSPLAPITSGVIQGSVLGPILFLLYINDALKHITTGEAFLFADDLKLAYHFQQDDISYMTHAIQHDLDALSTWSSSSGLKFSPEKSMMLISRCPNGIPPLFIGGAQITTSHTIRDLGLRYSNAFNFSSQAHYQIASARRLCYYILRFFHLPAIKLALYKQRVRPILEYCPMIFTHYLDSDRCSVEGIQRMFTKKLLSPGSPLTYKTRCDHFKLEPLWLRRLKLNLVFLHRLLHAEAHTVNTQCTVMNPLQRTRHSEGTIDIKLYRSAFRYNSFIPFYSRIWNKLPVSLRRLTNSRAFYKALSQHLSPINIKTLFTLQVTEDALFESGPKHV